MLTRIPLEKIIEILKGTSHEGSIIDIHKRERRNLLDAQLKDDKEKVQEVFEEIENRFFVLDADGNLIIKSVFSQLDVDWWQALKGRSIQ